MEQAGATVKLMEILRDRIEAYRETVSPAPPVVSWQRPVPPEQLQHSVINKTVGQDVSKKKKMSIKSQRNKTRVSVMSQRIKNAWSPSCHSVIKYVYPSCHGVIKRV